MEHKGLLSGMKVLDLSRVLAAPYCGMMLADLGAEVIKIERPGKGDDARSNFPIVNGESAYYMNLNRNKRGIVLNLKSQAGKEVFRKLVAQSDVVLEIYRPGVMDRLGLGYEELRKINPAIIYASVSGFGHYGPYHERAGYDIVGQAISGLMSTTGWPDSAPTRTGTAIADVMGGISCCVGILAAYINRLKTGEGEMLAALGLRYGSDEAIDFAVKIQKTLALEAYRSSVTMAEERGAFPIYDAAREKDNPMIGRIREADPELYARMVEHGRRNIALLTIAPTGTSSLMSQTTSGIEPVFRPVYKRRRKINPSDKGKKADFVDNMGEKFEEYYVYHHQFVKWLQINGYDTSKLQTISDEELDSWLKASPYYGATANDIDWVAKVRMQGAIQKWVDHSISVTVNLPNSVTEDLVADVYRTAWESGCKGVTGYRDGCREGVLLDAKEKERKKGHEGPAHLKRPKSIPADIVRFKNGNEDWIAFVGLQDDRPYEIFTGKIEEDAMYIPRKITKGWIIKVHEPDGSKRYDFQYVDRYGYTNTIGGISRLFNEEFWNYAKLISGVLRHGMPIDKVVHLIDGLHLNSESINTWKNGVQRALKQYIADGTKSKDKCPQCGQEEMAYQNGCLTCMSCGYSKCG